MWIVACRSSRPDLSNCCTVRQISEPLTINVRSPLFERQWIFRKICCTSQLGARLPLVVLFFEEVLLKSTSGGCSKLLRRIWGPHSNDFLIGNKTSNEPPNAKTIRVSNTCFEVLCCKSYLGASHIRFPSRDQDKKEAWRKKTPFPCPHVPLDGLLHAVHKG